MTEIETMSLEDINKYAKEKAIKSSIAEINVALEEGRVSSVVYQKVSLGKYRMYQIIVDEESEGN
jgi:hypothetical protein